MKQKMYVLKLQKWEKNGYRGTSKKESRQNEGRPSDLKVSPDK